MLLPAVPEWTPPCLPCVALPFQPVVAGACTRFLATARAAVRRMNHVWGAAAMTTINLSPTLRNRIAEVARRVRLLRALRGISLLVLVTVLTGGAALLADYLLDLPSIVRMALFSTWCGLGLTTFLFGLVRPLCRPLPPADLAAVIEEKYPDLGERLTSAAELAGA